MTESDDVIEIVPNDAVVPLWSARYWIQAVEFQARRVIATHAASFDFQAPAKMEEQFLLIATKKARRWLDIATKAGGLADNAKNRIDAFLAATATADDLRNFREHDDEYDLGRGRNMDRVNTVAEMGEKRFKVGHRINGIYRDNGPVGDISDINGLHILLGGRFDVIAAMTTAGDLADCLVAQENAATPGKAVPCRFSGPSYPAS